MENNWEIHVSTPVMVELFFRNALQLDEKWKIQQAEELLDAIHKTDIADILRIIDHIPEQHSFTSTELPQFGKVDTLINVACELSKCGTTALSFLQLGFFLKQDSNAKTNALCKYGETHGKGAQFIGLAIIDKAGVHPSAITYALARISDISKQKDITNKLLLRIPIVQQIIRMRNCSRIDVLDLMEGISETTKRRRAICLKRIIKDLSTYNNESLNDLKHRLEWR